MTEAFRARDAPRALAAAACSCFCCNAAGTSRKRIPMVGRLVSSKH
jgi:hypothetical protein